MSRKMESCFQVLFLLSVVCLPSVASIPTSASKPRILLHSPLTYGVNSHLMNMEKLAEFLSASGYDVYFAGLEFLLTRKYSHKVTVLTRPALKTQELSEAVFTGKDSWRQEKQREFQLGGWMRDQIHIECDTVMADEAFLNRLKQLDFSLLIYEFDCGLILGDYLGIPKIVYDAPGVLTMYRSLYPIPLSYFPMMHNPSSNRMTLLERANNVLDYVMANVLKSVFFDAHMHQLYTEKVGKQGSDFDQSFYNVSMVFINSKREFDFPVPTMLNALFVACFFLKAPHQLTLEPTLHELVNNKKVIYVSFGTWFKPTEKECGAMARALSRVESHIVIWQVRGELPFQLASHIHVVPWVDQASLLSRNETQLFIGHGGTNGVLETAFYAVPYLGIPLALNQASICQRIVSNHLGRCILKHELTEELFFQTIMDILSNPLYKHNANKMAREFQYSDPKADMLHWIETIIEHRGWPFIDSPFKHLSWYQYFLIDVLALFALLMATILVLCVGCLRCLRRRCTTKHNAEKRSKKE